MAGQLDVSFQSSGPDANLANVNETVEIFFTNPPQLASNVKVFLIETSELRNQQPAERLLATFRGQIKNSKFILDPEDTGDPLASPQPNPELPANLKKSSSPPTLDIRFDPGGKFDPKEKNKTISLPDVEDVNGFYKIKIKASGNVGGKQLTFTGTAILHVRLRFDVMIVPKVRPNADFKNEEIKLFADNARFAQQWRKAAAARRAVIEIPVDARISAFETAVSDAAIKANSGEVILFVGHGGAGGFRGLSFSLFDPVPVSIKDTRKHPDRIDSDVLSLPDRAIESPPGSGRHKVKPPSTDQSTVDDQARRFETLKRVGNSLKKNNVKRFVLLTCNIGKDTDFGFKLSKLLQTTVGGYRNLCASGEVIFSNPGKPNVILVQVWIMNNDDPKLDTARPDTKNDPNHLSFHEIPPNQRIFEP